MSQYLICIWTKTNLSKLGRKKYGSFSHLMTKQKIVEIAATDLRIAHISTLMFTLSYQNMAFELGPCTTSFFSACRNIVNHKDGFFKIKHSKTITNKDDIFGGLNILRVEYWKYLELNVWNKIPCDITCRTQVLHWVYTLWLKL